MISESPILLFDGECKVCNFWVQFIQKRQPENKFEYLPLQSDKGKLLLEEFKIDSSIDSIVFIWKEKAFIKSNAALQIIKQFGFWWRLLLVFWLVPRPIRDFGYDIIAKNRHRFFVTKKECDLH